MLDRLRSLCVRKHSTCLACNIAVRLGDDGPYRAVKILENANFLARGGFSRHPACGLLRAGERCFRPWEERMGMYSPDYEVIVCPPDESFRWNVHGYPHHLAKWHYHPEYELHLILETSGRMMIGDYIGPFEPGTLILTGPNLPHNWVSEIGPDD